MIEWNLAAMSDVAAAMRPDWDPGETRDALAAMWQARPGFPGLAMLTLARHIANEHATSYDLLNTTRNPLGRSIPKPGDPSVRDRELRPLRDLFATRERERQEAAGRREHGDGPR